MSGNVNITKVGGLAPIVSIKDSISISADKRLRNVSLNSFVTPPSEKPASCCGKITSVPVIGHIIRAIIWLFKTLFPCCFSKPQAEIAPALGQSMKEYVQSMTPQKMAPLIDTLEDRTRVYTECAAGCPTANIADLVSLSGLHEDLKVLQGDLGAFEAQFSPESLPKTPAAKKKVDPDKEEYTKCQDLIPRCREIGQSVERCIQTLKDRVRTSKTINSTLEAARKEIDAQANTCKTHPNDFNERFLLNCNFSNYFRAVRNLKELGFDVPDTDEGHQRMFFLSHQIPKSPRQSLNNPTRIWTQVALNNAGAIRLHSDDQKGIRNIGNSCYMNSGIQMLLGTPELVRLVNTPLQRRNGESDNQLEARNAVQTHLAFVLEALRGGDDNMVEAGMRALRDTIFCEKSRLHLNTDLKRHPGRHPDEMYIQHDGEAFINTVLSLLDHQVLCQEVRSFTQEAARVDHPLSATDFNTIIRLPVVANKNMQQSWDAYFAATNVNDPKNGFNYKSTKITNYTTRSRIINHLPEFIAVQMKRFSGDPLSTDGPQKIFDRVPCGNDGKVDITEYVDPALRHNQARIEYQLVGFQLHHGASVTSGHYTGCRRGPDGKWLHYDDNRPVRELTRDQVEDMMSQAYNLLFVRVH